jgi:phosphatidate cytidylyltransferase
VQQRVKSSVGVVIVGLVPAFMGGPVWAVALAVLFAIGAHEYQALAVRISPGTRPFGLLLVPAFALVAATGGGAQALLGIVALAVGLPLFESILRKDLRGTFVEWALSAAGTLYLGVPLFAAVAMRKTEGSIDAGWLTDLAEWVSLGWAAAPRGLAWLLVVILVTWLSDSGAYLVGRSYGRRPLVPVVSPKKTVEGLIGGLVAAALTGAVAVVLFGLNVSWAIGLLLGIVIGAIGVVGDLAESIMKRQAGVKDSGTLIPGHGGMLDRLDALLFTFTAGWYLASLIDRTFT